MILTKKTVLTIVSPENFPQQLANEVIAFIDSMITQQKTDGIRIEINPDVYERHWINQDAAEEYAAFIFPTFEKYNIPVLDLSISDYTAPA